MNTISNDKMIDPIIVARYFDTYVLYQILPKALENSDVKISKMFKDLGGVDSAASINKNCRVSMLKDELQNALRQSSDNYGNNKERILRQVYNIILNQDFIYDTPYELLMLFRTIKDNVYQAVYLSVLLTETGRCLPRRRAAFNITFVYRMNIDIYKL